MKTYAGEEVWPDEHDIDELVLSTSMLRSLRTLAWSLEKTYTLKPRRLLNLELVGLGRG